MVAWDHGKNGIIFGADMNSSVHIDKKRYLYLYRYLYLNYQIKKSILLILHNNGKDLY